MAKRVLGNDPFADGKNEETTAKGARASKRPPAPVAHSKSGKDARPSVKPPTPSKAPPAAAKGSKSATPAKPEPSKSAVNAARKGAVPTRPEPSKPVSAKTAAPAKAPEVPEVVKPAVATASEPEPTAAPIEAPKPSRVVIETIVESVAITMAEPVAKPASAPSVESAEEVAIPPAPRTPDVRVEASAFDDDERGTEDESIASVDLPPNLQRTQSWTPSEPPAALASNTGEVKEDIRTIEAEIDRLLEKVSDRGADREALDRVAARLREKMADEGGAETPSEAPPALRDDVFDVARELLSSDYYRRQWGRVAMRDRSEEVDDFGLDPKYAARVRPLFDFLYERWWRVETHDIDRVPSEGRVILCANHSGALPYDGAMLATALRREHPAHRELRWLAEDFIFHFPFLGVFMNRIGAVRACQENAERLLRKSTCVGVFPEGVKGIAKLYRDRYRLQRFGRGGHVKLAIRTRTPIVPVAILGAEEAHPLIAPTSILAKALGVPFVPITPTFPWLGPVGLVPLPSKWKIFFLDPIPMDGYAPEAADDEVLVGRLNEKIRGLIQDELDRAVKSRQSVLRG